MPWPLLLPEGLQLTPDQFEAVCQAKPNAVLGFNASGQLIQMTLTGGETGARNSTLPDGSVFSPDASLVRLDRWQAITFQALAAWLLCVARWPPTRPAALSSAGC